MSNRRTLDQTLGSESFENRLFRGPETDTIISRDCCLDIIRRPGRPIVPNRLICTRIRIALELHSGRCFFFNLRLGFWLGFHLGFLGLQERCEQRRGILLLPLHPAREVSRVLGLAISFAYKLADLRIDYASRNQRDVLLVDRRGRVQFRVGLGQGSLQALYLFEDLGKLLLSFPPLVRFLPQSVARNGPR